MRLVQRFLRFFPREILVTEIDQHEVIICATTDKLVSAISKLHRHGLCVLKHLFAVTGKVFIEYFTE
jgi:hypothetical protein